ncbi:GIY-YIG nuclease family protein [candidate division KSB1 bacterium]|nr:GIY-YIG nuclease family protein [candidate division KSB1 bacterium]
MYYTYVLKSLKNGSFYIGYTRHLQKRIRQHNAGKSSYTTKHRPYKLVHHEKFESKQGAVEKEKYLKSLKNIKGYLQNNMQ